MHRPRRRSRMRGRFLRAATPDLLIVDIRLGEFNGLQLIMLSRTQIPAIVISGFADPLLQHEARQAGARVPRQAGRARRAPGSGAAKALADASPGRTPHLTALSVPCPVPRSPSARSPRCRIIPAHVLVDGPGGRVASRCRVLNAQAVDLSGEGSNDADRRWASPNRGVRGRPARGAARARPQGPGRPLGGHRTDRRAQRPQPPPRLRRRSAHRRRARSGPAADRRPDADGRDHTRRARGVEVETRRQRRGHRQVDRRHDCPRGRGANGRAAH